MQYQVELRKRIGKRRVYIAALIFCIFFGLVTLINIYLPIIFLIGAVYIIFTLIDSNKPNQSLVVKIEGDQLEFYNQNDKGIQWNKSTHSLSSIKNIYILKKRKRLGIYHNTFLEYKYVKSSGYTSTKEIEVFPSLLECSDEELNYLMLFIKNANPAIELGYNLEAFSWTKPKEPQSK